MILTKLEDRESFLATSANRSTLNCALHHPEKVAGILYVIHEKDLLVSRALFFDSISREYPSMHRCLEIDSEIVQNHHFEGAIVQLLNGKKENLTDFEQRSMTAS